jgi:hypothetical protein
MEGVGGKGTARDDGENNKSDPGITGNGSSDLNMLWDMALFSTGLFGVLVCLR